MTYQYETPVGTFTIRPQRSDPNRVELCVDNEPYGSYMSARQAASDVYAHVTGFSAWDSTPHLDAPEDPNEWRKV